jgi:RNA polymerase sigma factor (sigma-70 family)
MFRPGRTLETFAFDRGYVQRLSDGDSETTTHFFRYFKAMLTKMAGPRLRESGQAEDVAQETMCRVLLTLKKEGGIREPEKLGGFVRKVCKNVMFEFFREGGKFPQVPENTPDPVERALSAETSYITRERMDRIWHHFQKLKKRDQDLLRKVFLDEQDKDAICLELNISREYLRLQIFRALASLRKVMEEGGEPPLSNKAKAS